MKNYYQILNIKQTATEDEIKRSYRVLAKKYHPDVNPGDAKAADRFADINEAHDVLSDPAKRADYDKKLAAANAPKPRPEDIIARQRAAAQAAARQAAARQAAVQQAAMRNTIRENLRSGADPSVILAQRAAAQAAAAQAAAAQAQAQAQQYQAQLSAVERKAHESGVAAGKRIAQTEITKLEAEIKSLKAENDRLKNRLAETESDRSDLEQELFDRDREYNEQKMRADDLEKELYMQKQTASTQRASAATTRDYDELNSEMDSLNAVIEELTERTKKMEAERNQAELKAKAQLELQQEKRRELLEQIDELNAEIADLNEQIDELRAENERWEQYAKSEDFISAAELKMQEWERKQKADKKLARPTLYGTLGVLIWATDDEIAEAFNKLEKRYSTKPDDVSAAKLADISAAYATLSDEAKRKEYNASIDITEERIAEERKFIEENAKLEEEYRAQLDDKEFWAWFDELNFNAQTGDAEAQNRLGEMYYYGDEIEKDVEQAVYWFKEAAKQKHADAMYNLGVCFVNGEGVEKNAATGTGFIRQAAKLGSKAAQQYKF